MYEAGETQIIHRRRVPAMGWVAILSGLREGHLVQVRPEGTILGRESTCDIQLDEPSVSGRHAKIWVDEGEGENTSWTFLIQDMASTNGTHVNGKEILREELHDGDVIELGEAKMVFKCIELPQT